MATFRGILGQGVPPAATLTGVYTVPTAKNATLRVIATNTGASATKFRVSLAKSGEADSLKQYIAYDVSLAEFDTGSTITVMADASDVIRCYSLNGAVAFTVTGLQQDRGT